MYKVWPVYSVAWPGGKFIKITQHECVRNILIAYGLLPPEIESILRTKNAGVETGEYGEAAIGVGERFGESVRRQKVEPIPEPALGLD